jgi:hypothetical protein
MRLLMEDTEVQNQEKDDDKGKDSEKNMLTFAVITKDRK